MCFDRNRNVLDSMSTPTRLGQLENLQATWLAQEVIQSLRGIGVFAVEMFQLPGGDFVVNEISPRVHNSGHHTLDVGGVSQFEQHLRAVCDLKLAAVDDAPPEATLRNLLYTDDLAFLLDCPPGTRFSDEQHVHLHWYGKRQPHAGRKVGHVTCLCADSTEAERRIDRFVTALRGRFQAVAS